MSVDDENDIWNRVLKTITPISRERSIFQEKKRDKKKTSFKKSSSLFSPSALPAKEAAKEENLKPGSGMNGRAQEKLRKGKMKIEGKLDLHGMTQDLAKDALISFIQSAYDNEKRSLLVITGKGRKKERHFAFWEVEPGVLKQNVPRWLQMPPLSALVLDYYEARPKDGGAGALYILLRKRR